MKRESIMVKFGQTLKKTVLGCAFCPNKNHKDALVNYMTMDGGSCTESSRNRQKVPRFVSQVHRKRGTKWGFPMRRPRNNKISYLGESSYQPHDPLILFTPWAKILFNPSSSLSPSSFLHLSDIFLFLHLPTIFLFLPTSNIPIINHQLLHHGSYQGEGHSGQENLHFSQAC